MGRETYEEYKTRVNAGRDGKVFMVWIDGHEYVIFDYRTASHPVEERRVAAQIVDVGDSVTAKEITLKECELLESVGYATLNDKEHVDYMGRIDRNAPLQWSKGVGG